MQQLGLSFDARDPAPAWDLPEPRARSTDPETSKAAAAHALAFAESHAGKIFAALATPGTCKEIGARIGLDHVAVARRLSEMEEANLIETTGEKRDGCRVWRRKRIAA
jgi:hypothetical protein